MNRSRSFNQENPQPRTPSVHAAQNPRHYTLKFQGSLNANIIGRGSQGSVYAAHLQHKKNEHVLRCALKELSKNQQQSDELGMHQAASSPDGSYASGILHFIGTYPQRYDALQEDMALHFLFADPTKDRTALSDNTDNTTVCKHAIFRKSLENIKINELPDAEKSRLPLYELPQWKTTKTPTETKSSNTKNSPTVYAIMPLCDGTLSAVFSKLNIAKQHPQYSKYVPHVQFIVLKSLTRALTTLDQRKIVHGDIKLANVGVRFLETGEMYCTLFDFGLAKPYSDFYAGQYKFLGTREYMSPEIVASLFVDDNEKAPALANPSGIDVYSAGKLLQFLFNMTLPSAFAFFTKPITTVKTHHTVFDKLFAELLTAMCESDSAKRFPLVMLPSAAEKIQQQLPALSSDEQNELHTFCRLLLDKNFLKEGKPFSDDWSVESNGGVATHPN